ncbi:MAG: DUF3298 domain-containing protein [Pseudomonadota bacterium]|nr:DUF3298 domain-containing protein [Pseudomonadota bacterium]
MRRLLIASVLASALLACTDKGAAPSVDARANGDTVAANPVDNLPLGDVIVRNQRFLIGITYPSVANQHPKLAEAIRRYADDARAELDEAVRLAGDSGQANMPYDLSLNFTEQMKKPEVVVVAADGSLYTGGAHGIPLIARFTYLPQEDRLLLPQDLIPDRAGWEAVSRYVRQQLSAQVASRLDEDDVSPEDRASIQKSALAMIEEGTEPDAGNYAQFEPIPAADGKWYGLRFVFPPYQVGPYSDGTQSVEVPVSVLRAHLAAKYRVMFTGG